MERIDKTNDIYYETIKNLSFILRKYLIDQNKTIPIYSLHIEDNSLSHLIENQTPPYLKEINDFLKAEIRLKIPQECKNTEDIENKSKKLKELLKNTLFFMKFEHLLNFFEKFFNEAYSDVASKSLFDEDWIIEDKNEKIDFKVVQIKFLNRPEIAQNSDHIRLVNAEGQYMMYINSEEVKPIKQTETNLIANDKIKKKTPKSYEEVKEELIIIKKPDTMEIIDNMISEFNKHVKGDEKPKEKEHYIEEEDLIYPVDYDDEDYDVYTYNDPDYLEYKTFLAKSVRKGNNYYLYFEDVELTNISEAFVSEITMNLLCDTCNKMILKTNFMKINEQHGILYCGGKCPNCKNEIRVIFKPNIISRSSKDRLNIGYLSCNGSTFVSIYTPLYHVKFKAICDFNCSEDFQEINSNEYPTDDEAHLNFCCKCERYMFVKFKKTSFSKFNSSDVSFLDNLSIENFSYNNLTSSSFKEVQNIADKGTCIHDRTRYYLVKYDCCQTFSACEECHKQTQHHIPTYLSYNAVRTIMCGYCSFIQSLTGQSHCYSCSAKLRQIDSYSKNNKQYDIIPRRDKKKKK